MRRGYSKNLIGVNIMPRKARMRSSTGIYHIMLRGINRQSIFENNDDKNRFVATISEYKNSEKFKIYGFCIMDNHVHLIIQELEDDISKVVKRLSSSYVYWYNKKYERIGHLFQERFRSECIEDEGYFLNVLRYIHQNPIKAGMVKSPNQYDWSSFNYYIGKSDIIDYKFGLSIFSENESEAVTKFIKFMNEESKTKHLDYEDFIKLTDEEVKQAILSFGLNKTSDILLLNTEDRDKILNKLKAINGISVRQLSRITGLSRTTITKA